METLEWEGSIKFRDLVGLLLETPRDWPWPPSRAGVYVVTSATWVRRPNSVLYTGSGGNLLDRVGELVRDLLGFFGELESDPKKGVGAHSGAQSLWHLCHAENKPVGDLFIGWAATTAPCHFCMEKSIAEVFKPSLNKRGVGSKCCCVA